MPTITPTQPRRPTSTPTNPVTTNKTASRTLASQLPADWKKALGPELNKPYFKELEKFLADERRTHSVLPSPEQVFAALRRTPVDKVKVVLLGQDPYPTKGDPNGLSFSVEKGQPIPGSLRNMFKVMHTDVGAPIPKDGDLTPWADQGVLLLNTVLTVREGLANSHREEGWELFTNAILEVVNKKDDRVAFMLLGKQAQEVAKDVDTSKHAIINAPHPSPGNFGNPFGKSRPFSAVNKALIEAGRKPIRWDQGVFGE